MVNADISYFSSCSCFSDLIFFNMDDVVSFKTISTFLTGPIGD